MIANAFICTRILGRGHTAVYHHWIGWKFESYNTAKKSEGWFTIRSDVLYGQMMSTNSYYVTLWCKDFLHNENYKEPLSEILGQKLEQQLWSQRWFRKVLENLVIINIIVDATDDKVTSFNGKIKITTFFICQCPMENLFREFQWFCEMVSFIM